MSQEARRARVREKWSPPEGPLPAGEQGDPELRPADGESLDMLSGEWRIFQRRDGHRYSTDDLLCAFFASACATARAVTVRRAIDLGTGIGSIAMIIGWTWPCAQVVGVEAQEISANLFARSIRYNGAADRIQLRRGDLRDPSLTPPDHDFDLVTGSPPYFDEGDGVVSDRPQRGPCRFEQKGGVEQYAAAGARVLSDLGVMALVHTWAARERVAKGAEDAGLEVVASRPIVLREGREPHLVGVAGDAARRHLRVRGHVEPLVIRDTGGARTTCFSEARQSIGFPP